MEERVERPLMGEEEFSQHLQENIKYALRNIHIGASRFKSVRRAIRRGLMSSDGTIYPRRPFNNRANTSTRKGADSRKLNSIKKQIYGQYSL